MIIVYRYRVKSLNGLLNKQARAVNFVWNFCNDTQKHALKWGKKWPSAFDMINLTAGSSTELGLLSASIGAVCRQYVASRVKGKRPYLRYRGRKSIGWIPVRGETLKREGNAFRFHSKTFRVFDPRPLPAGKILDGSTFSQDAKGNWFLNVVLEVETPPQRALTTGVGVDLGLKSFAALSTGETIDNPRHFQQLEARLGKAQRAGKKRLAQNTHASIANARKDFLHKLSTRIVLEFDYIAVGNVSASKLAKTSMAKSVADASWSAFRSMLAHKAIKHGAWYEEVNESNTTRTCSCCGVIPDSSPKGRGDLGIRAWTCSSCGAVHERDTNAAVNIKLRHGHVPPAEGIVGRRVAGMPDQGSIGAEAEL